MKNFYMGVIVKIESIFTDNIDGYYAYMAKFKSSDNLKSVLDRIGGLQVANVCATKQDAQELVKTWNEGFKQNGVYAFDNPAF